MSQTIEKLLPLGADEDLREFVKKCRDAANYHARVAGLEDDLRAMPQFGWAASISVDLMAPAKIEPTPISTRAFPKWSSRTTVAAVEIPLLRVYTVRDFERAFVKKIAEHLPSLGPKYPEMVMRLQGMICRIEKSLEQNC